MISIRCTVLELPKNTCPTSRTLTNGTIISVRCTVLELPTNTCPTSRTLTTRRHGRMTSVRSSGPELWRSTQLTTVQIRLHWLRAPRTREGRAQCLAAKDGGRHHVRAVSVFAIQASAPSKGNV